MEYYCPRDPVLRVSHERRAEAEEALRIFSGTTHLAPRESRFLKFGPLTPGGSTVRDGRAATGFSAAAWPGGQQGDGLRRPPDDFKEICYQPRVIAESGYAIDLVV